MKKEYLAYLCGTLKRVTAGGIDVRPCEDVVIHTHELKLLLKNMGVKILSEKEYFSFQE